MIKTCRDCKKQFETKKISRATCGPCLKVRQNRWTLGPKFCEECHERLPTQYDLTTCVDCLQEKEILYSNFTPENFRELQNKVRNLEKVIQNLIENDD